MGKKIFIVFLILSFIHLIGCSSVGEVTKDEFLKTKNRKVYLFTDDLEKFSFESGNYIVKNDTLNGMGIKEDNSLSAGPFKGSLPLDKVNVYQTEYIDGLKTFGLVIGFLAIGLLILSAIFLVSLDNIFSGD